MASTRMGNKRVKISSAHSTCSGVELVKTSTVGGTGGSVKTYWFARNVGKVREEGGNQVEELTAYTPAN